ncbi:hypothetical protein [Oceanobacillus damuensis]|uniref:hypothetical protein n=1 Tax=Oceanobacillus damuensis TaxID=937928 RepID=UPI000AE2C5F3|nr:hypothetical protein [Oceanobacillus damuensis]
MKSFYLLCHGTTDKLGRKLREEEIRFLQWMYKRYTEEELEAESKQKENHLHTMNS